MSHELLRLTNSLFSQPLLMTQSSCEDVLQYLDKRNSASLKDLTDIASADFGGIFEEAPVKSISGVGVIDIHGPISTYKTGFEAICKNLSLEYMIEQAEAYALDDSVNTVLLNVRSGGGQAHKAFEQARRLREVVESSGKKLICYIDQISASCAYILSSVADEVIINPSAESGSIGVLIELMNNSEALKKEGYSRQFITSSDGKVPFNDEGEFREEFLADLQTTVSELYENFIDHVATYRGMDKQVIRDTNAGVYSAKKSLELGLVDKIMETEEFYNYLSTSSKELQNQKETLMSDPKVVETPQLSVDEIASMQAELAQFKAAKVEATKASLTASLESKSFLAECQGSLVEFFMNAEVGEDVKTLMNTVISGADASMSNLVAEHGAELTSVKEELNGKVEAAEALVVTANAEVDAIKTEFATGKFSVDAETKDTNISHAEKLAAAVAAEKAKQTLK